MMLPTWKKILERPFVVWLIHSHCRAAAICLVIWYPRRAALRGVLRIWTAFLASIRFAFQPSESLAIRIGHSSGQSCECVLQRCENSGRRRDKWLGQRGGSEEETNVKCQVFHHVCMFFRVEDGDAGGDWNERDNSGSSPLVGFPVRPGAGNDCNGGNTFDKVDDIGREVGQ